MKHLLLIALVALASCGNGKEQITEQIKSYKDSLGTVAKQEAKLLDEITAAQSKYIGQESLDSVNAIEMRQAPERTQLLGRKIYFQGKIDSLELELRKY
jgi:hypothetical protein